MSSFAVISVVNNVIKDLLNSGLSGVFSNDNSGDFVILKSPKDMPAGASKCLSLFLYQVLENAYVKNQPMRRIDAIHPTTHINAVQLQYPPLALNCHYLLTPYGDDQTSDDLTTYRFLGKAMQVLFDNAILKGPALMARLENIQQESFCDLIEEIRIILNPLSLDDLTKLWNALNTPLRLSASYEVRVIMIESEKREELSMVVEKEAHYFQITGNHV